jgi:hypothetical protein
VTPTDTSLGTIVLWVAALSTLISCCSLLWTIFSGPARRNASKLDVHGTRLDAHELRLGAIDQTLRAIPAKEELHELELAMTRLQGEMKTMSEAMRGQAEIMKRVEALVGRHEDHLLKK